MIEEGERAPDFRLPAVVDGQRREVSLADHLEENVVVLAFYPGDFNPACDAQSTDLDELELFMMQKDVAVLGISGDSVHSHRAFADEYDLHVPLLADVHGEVTEAYGVGADDPGYLTRRAVVVVDPEGVVRYAWAGDSLEHLPDVDRVRGAVEGVGGGGMALARYRVGHAHYVEGRRAFSSATAGFEQREWLMAKHDFAQAEEEFAEAADTFDTAARFADAGGRRTYYERAGRKAEELSRAAEWLARSAGAFASGEGREGEQLRADAETPLEAARDIPDPVAPEEFPPDDLGADDTAEDGAEPGPAGDPAALAGGGVGAGEAGGTTGPAGQGERAGPKPDSDAGAGGAGAATAGGFTRSASGEGGGAGGERADGSGADDSHAGRSDGDEGGAPEGADRIDDAELAEIAAELEDQSRDAADGPETDGVEGGESGAKGSADDAEAVDGEVDLDLADPAGDDPGRDGAGGGANDRMEGTDEERAADGDGAERDGGGSEAGDRDGGSGGSP